MTKYREYFLKMLDLEREAFEAFRVVHDKYNLDPEEYQDEYNEAGNKILYIVRRYEDKLCGRSEGSGYGRYSGNLAEKFQAEIKKEFPRFDSIGIKVFKLKQISPK